MQPPPPAAPSTSGAKVRLQHPLDLPLLPSQDDTRIQLRRNSGIKLKVSGKAEKS